MPREVVSRVISEHFERGIDAGASSCHALFTNDAIWYGPAGFGVAYGCDSYYDNFLKPLYAAFPSRAVHVDVLTCEGAYCGVHGEIAGAQRGAWLGVAATNNTVRIRFGFHYRVEVGGDGTGRVADAWALLDLPQAFASMGVDLFARYREETSTVLLRE